MTKSHNKQIIEEIDPSDELGDINQKLDQIRLLFSESVDTMTDIFQTISDSVVSDIRTEIQETRNEAEPPRDSSSCYSEELNNIHNTLARLTDAINSLHSLNEDEFRNIHESISQMTEKMNDLSDKNRGGNSKDSALETEVPPYWWTNISHFRETIFPFLKLQK